MLLEHWQIPLDQWTTICAGASQSGPRPRIGPQEPAIGTTLTWESVTQAEHLHSPLLTRMRREGTGRTGTRLVILDRSEKHRP